MIFIAASQPSPLRTWIPILVAATVFFAFTASASSQSDEALNLSSKRYIVIDADTGEVFAEKDADEPVAIASLTKIFTTIEAIERGELDQKISTKSSDLYDSNSTLMGFGPGETFTLKDLLYGMMLPSGNDAAHAIARALGQEDGMSDDEAVANFVSFINTRVENMGLTQTRFVNPHGWGEDGHYSTARDVAAFAMYALEYPLFRDIIGAYSYTTSDGTYTVINTNKLITTGYSGLVGGKTGYDDDSGYCLIEVAERGDSTMISVTLDGEAPDTWYQDNVTLLDTGFASRQQRISDGLPVQGEALSYRDPDASEILKVASTGSTLGTVPSPDLTLGAADPASSESQTGGSSLPDSSSSQSSPSVGLSAQSGSVLSSALAVGAVVAVIALVVAGRAYSERNNDPAAR